MAPARWQARRILTKKRTQFPLTLSHVAFVSQYVRQKHQQAGIRPPDARVIYNGIDPYPFLAAAQRRKPAPDALRLLYIGGLTPAKGVHVAIEALGVLKRSEELNNLSLRIVGGGQPDYENKLRQRVVDLGLEAYVTFQGREPRRKIPAIMAEHDVLLFTSIYEEPIARTVMEGMAAGLAVIATAVGGQAEMLEDGANALVTPPGDVNALATTIVRLKRDTGLRRHLATAGRKTIQTHFTLKRMVDEIEAWLQEIVV
jgi:glycosyltransferase involved in cell wall biosynthesis